MSQSERQLPARPADGRVQELRASAHLMNLETGTFCLVNGSAKLADNVIGGVRVSVTDPSDSNVAIASLRPDGWLSGGGDSALIRVLEGPAQILITIYQPAGATESAPKLRVLRLSDPAPGADEVPAAPARRPVMVAKDPLDVVAHVQRQGDLTRHFGEWVGTPGSKMAIEGFSIAVPKGLEPEDVTYQAVLGRGWMSPWSEAGQFCGSRGMALPLLGLRIKLSPAAAKRYDLRYSASFIDGTKRNDVKSEEACETPGLSPLEALRVELTPKGAAKPGPKIVAPAPVAEDKAKKKTRAATR